MRSFVDCFTRIGTAQRSKHKSKMKTPRDSDRSSSAPSAKKRRNMNPLSINAHESRYSETSQTKEYYLETRGREELSPESIRRQSKRNRENKLKGLNLHDILYSSDPIILIPDRENLKGVKGIYSAQRNAIYYHFVLLGSPPRDEWEETHIVSHIMDVTSIPRTARSSVEKVLDDILLAQSRSEEYDADANLLRTGLEYWQQLGMLKVQ